MFQQCLAQIFFCDKMVFVRRAEDFCLRVGGRDDVWYATNIEVVDYINATKALRISIDLDTFYNPSAISVWLTVDGMTLEIPAGKTVKI